MPTLQLKITPPQSTERLGLLARRLTDLSTEVLGKRREVTAVVIEELWPGRWFIGGRNPRDPTAMLEIRVTEGTNSVEEKEDFIAAAWQELQQQLGPLEEGSYVVVQEVPATDWGYGGRTQAARRMTVPVL
ncbi:tautomerase family protein [Ramlibacter alkalitolerans]|uniref:Tautomerase family protein n=1 Tax=Ramlibacter alkalitolerans TaxID=2039631 RepID=A0ABS1JJF5_9BURK|nr:tautomerase family protein [Ramlibacter alkalitolerans]MBL0424364.1 tautomerase family protein [Ramlibacter alkalitolerans]